MRLLFVILFVAACLSAPAAHTQVQLVLAAERARPGDTFLAGVHLHMEKGWHTYWRNSGGFGFPTTIDWKLPKGVTAGAIQWPTPEKLPDKEGTTYIYENDVVLLASLTIAPDLQPGPLQLEAFLAAGDLHVLRIDVFAEAGKFEMALIVGASHEAGIAVLDFGAHLGIRDAAAAIQILGKPEKRNARVRLIFLVLVQRGASSPCHAGNRERESQRQS